MEKASLIFLYFSALPVQASINGAGHCINGKGQIEKLRYTGLLFLPDQAMVS